MPPLKYEQILSELKENKYRPVYFLYGLESYFIDRISDYIEKNALTDAEKSFNQTVIYGKDADQKAIIDNARRYPMMAQRQVLILKEAQDMKDFKELQPYFENPSPTTVFVIAYKHKKFNIKTKFGKTLSSGENAAMESKPLYDNKIPNWIIGHLKDHHLKISPKGATIIADYLGTDLSKIANELEKLTLNLEKGTEITIQHIEKQIGISREYNVFELQNALGQRNVKKASQIVQNFIANPKKNPTVVVIASLYNFFSKVYLLHFLKNANEREILKATGIGHSFFLKDYRMAMRNYPYHKIEIVLSILKEFDLKSKGVEYNATGKPEGELLKEMVYRILH